MADPITGLNKALSGRYRIERQLGEGGMATVYLADDLATVRTDPTFRVESHEPFTSLEGFSLASTIQSYDVSPDGERILAIRDLSDAPTRIVMVQNFFEELEWLAPN